MSINVIKIFLYSDQDPVPKSKSVHNVPFYNHNNNKIMTKGKGVFPLFNLT